MSNVPPDPAHDQIRRDLAHWKAMALTIQENTRADMEQKIRDAWRRGFDDGFSAVDEAIETMTDALRKIASAMSAGETELRAIAGRTMDEWDAKRRHAKRYRSGRSSGER